MKSNLKKVLSYIAIAFLGFATGVGCLIGVSSCSAKNDDHQETQIKANRKEAKIVPDNSKPLTNEGIYYFVAKNYSNDGEGVFYQDSITLVNSAIVSQGNRSVYASFDIIDNNEKIYSTLYFEMKQNSGVYKLNFVYLNMANQSEQATIYYAEGGYFRRQYCAFTCTNFSRISGSEAYSVLNQFFDIYELGNEYFHFANFNYNMLIQVNNSFIERALYPVSNLPVNLPSSYPNPIEYSMPYFYSGSLVFNKIRVYWEADLGYNFEQKDGSFKTYAQPVVNTYVAYFKSMSYYNSVTDYEAPVCARASYIDGTGYSATHIFYNPTWVNDSYKTITLFDNLTNIRMRNILTGVNNGVEGFAIKNDINVGLSNVFDLLALAFTSWTSLFAIEIVPGISIGLLMFLPLITGIIIVIIWIVKR